MRFRTVPIALSIAALLSSSAIQAETSAQKLSVVAASRAAAGAKSGDARLAGVPTLWIVLGVAAVVGILIATDVIDFDNDKENPTSP
jgi:hypothetical protein